LFYLLVLRFFNINEGLNRFEKRADGVKNHETYLNSKRSLWDSATAGEYDGKQGEDV